MNTNNPKFQRQQRSIEDLNKICGESFKAVTIPDNWKFKQYERVLLEEEAEIPEIQAIAAIFMDKNTTGIDLTHYRLTFHTYSERLSITVINFIDFGKQAYKCLISNKLPTQITEYIQTLNN